MAVSINLRADALTTLERAQELGSGLSAVEDNPLTLAINAVSQAVHRFVGRPLYRISTTEEAPELLQGRGRDTLQLRAYPVVEIESVLLGGEEIEDFSTASQFLRDGRLYRESGWPWSVPRWNDLTGDPNTGRARYNVAVAYTGGYYTPQQADEGEDEGEPLPDEIELAVLREVSDLLAGARNTGRIRREKTAGGYEVEYAMSGIVALSRETQDVLSGYVLGELP